MLASSALFKDEIARFLAIKSRVELAMWLHITDRKLRYILYVLEPAARYRTFTVPKRHGGRREIQAPSKSLMRIQRQLSQVIAHVGQPSSVAKGFVSGRSIVDHAKTHRKRHWVLCVDLKDFFPSIKFWRVRGMFMAAPFSFNADVATCLAQLCTHEQALPQGAPTSPAISNIICRQLDRRIKDLCQSEKCAFTRYADDICISSNMKDVPATLAERKLDTWIAGEKLSQIIEQCGFAVNPAKTRLKTKYLQQMVTGLVVNRQVSVPRTWRRQLRVMLHLRRKYGEKKAMDIVKTWAWHGARRKKQRTIDPLIRGKAAFAAHIEKDRGLPFTRGIYYSYPGSRELIPRPYRGHQFRVLTEGVTDVDHFKAAHRRLTSEGRYDYLTPTYPELRIKGSSALVHELEYIARTAPDELTIGVLDADEPDFLRRLKLEPGQFVHRGGATYVMCLARPAWAAQTFCIEDLYSWEEASALCDGRRLFKWSEFGEDGTTADGTYRVIGNRSNSIYVTQRVERTSDGFSALLSKQNFSELILARHPPFDDMNFSGFSGTFDTFQRILEHHLGRRRLLSR